MENLADLVKLKLLLKLIINILSKIIETLKSTNMFNRIIISTNSQLASQFEYEYVIIDDEHHQNKGPLTGIYSVMKQYMDEELFFIVSVDTPMITSKAVNGLYHFMVSNLIESRLDIVAFKEGEICIPTIGFIHFRRFLLLKSFKFKSFKSEACL